MIRASEQDVGFHKALHVAILLGLTILPGPAIAQPNRTKMKGFWVAGSSSVTVKADGGILFLALSWLFPAERKTPPAPSPKVTELPARLSSL